MAEQPDQIAHDFREAFLFHLAHGKGSVCYGRSHYAHADILLAFETAAKAVKPVSTSGDQVEVNAGADETLTASKRVKVEGVTAGETAQPADKVTPLRECPFCKWDKRHRRGWDNLRGACVQCDNCLAMVFGPTQNDADSLWNTCIPCAAVEALKASLSHVLLCSGTPSDCEDCKEAEGHVRDNA